MTREEAIAVLTRLVDTNLHSDAWEQAHAALESIAAPALPVGVERAIEFWERLREQDGTMAMLRGAWEAISARDAAVTRAAELALLERIEASVTMGHALQDAVDDIREELTR